MSEPVWDDPPPPLAFAHFVDRIGESFPATTSAGESVELRLIDARSREPQPRVAAGFSLDFRVEPEDGAHPKQRTFTLEHPEVGPHAIFLVPVDRDDLGTIYQATFSFLPDSDGTPPI